jgi:hypothetical protein
VSPFRVKAEEKLKGKQKRYFVFYPVTFSPGKSSSPEIAFHRDQQITHHHHAAASNVESLNVQHSLAGLRVFPFIIKLM